MSYLEQQIQVEPGVVLALLESGDDHLDSRLAVAECERDNGRVNDLRAGLDTLEVVHRGHAADVVAVDVHRQTDLVDECFNHALGAVRREHARHVLDGDGICAEFLELLRVLNVRVDGVNRRDGVRDGTLEVCARLLDGESRLLDVPNVVQRVEHAEDIDAIAVSSVHEAVHNLI